MIIISDSKVSFAEYIRNMSRTVKMTALSITAFVVVIIAMMIGGIGFSYEVIYNGESVGRIKDSAVLSEAKLIAGLNVAHADNAKISFTEPDLRYSFSFRGADTSAAQLSDRIIENSESIVNGYSVQIDGRKEFYVASKEATESIVNAYCSSFDIADAKSTSSLSAKVVYTPAYIDVSALSDDESVKSTLIGLDVVTVAEKETEYAVPYETLTTRTSKKKQGYTAVTVAGVNGVNKKVEQITYLNGVKGEVVLLSDVVVKAPVNEQVTVGTAKATYTTTVQNASAKGFIWPLGVKGVITSYWGDGRGHKGLDIAAKAGTAIVAVKGGTVTYAGWKNDYGYNVIIDHGNGVQTRYAHSRKLLVKKGDVVTQGQVIAEVGTTGQSTGNHCHFEIIINGTRVNPAPYLGI